MSSTVDRTLPRSVPFVATEARAKARLKARTVTAASIDEREIERMHQVFCQYYEGHSLAQFRTDLREKDFVIVLYDAETRAIRGFSTLMRVEVRDGARVARGIYSGDTVVDRKYWGSTALGTAFLKFLWREKMKRPFRPLYWFLISKGYKTYLLMANNFAVHYPRHDRPTPATPKRIMDGFYGTKFASTYDADRGLIVPEGTSCHLRDHVAAIGPELLRNPRVRFFEETNPDWKDGVELTCLAEMSPWMPAKFVLRRMFKRTRR